MFGWCLAGGAVVLGAILLFAFGPLAAQRASSAPPTRAFTTVAGRPPQPPSMETSDTSDSGGIFQEQSQREEEPIVAIGNDSDYDMRLMMTDVNGSVRTEWIPAGTSKSLTVGQGQYEASIDAPNAYGIVPTNGTVDVKDFHHYEADFVVGRADGSETFHIGD